MSVAREVCTSWFRRFLLLRKVLLDTDFYEELPNEGRKTDNGLFDTDFYEELPNGTNPKYKAQINDKIDDLLSKELINDFEASNLKQGSRTSHFYGLPKIHKQYISFPPLRPICSGFNSCTAKISEFIDAYLKPLAQNTSSYIKDTSGFA